MTTTRGLATLIAAGALVVAGGAAAWPVHGQQNPPPRYGSAILIYDFETRSSTPVHEADAIWEAPNWSRDGTFLLSNSGGRLYRVPIDRSSAPAPIALDPALRANNDHDFSRDGRYLAISATPPGGRSSQIFIAEADGTNHRQVTTGPGAAYFHGWSPDGRFLAYVANPTGQYDMFRVPFAGGAPDRLTSDPAYDDGPDYAPDGRWIYFNSDRGGDWNVWRVPAEGGGPDDQRAQRVTDDALEDWFPHPSPDGRWLVFLSFPDGTVGHNDRNLRVQLRLIPLPGETVGEATPQVLVDLVGGQGTINVNSWAPDSRRFAYVAYRPLPPQAP